MSLAHELNHSLGIIAARSSAALAHRPGVPSTVTEDLRAIESDAFRAAEIIRRLRKFARAPGPGRSTIDINRLVQGSLALVRQMMYRSRVRIELALSDELPGYVGDSIRLQQAFLNLLRNALEACEMRPAPRILIETSGNTRSIVVTIHDSGPGFRRGDDSRRNRSTKPGGLGVGLSLSRSLMGAEGGRIVIGKSDLGGARVSIHLRRQKGESNGSKTARVPRSTRTSRTHRG